MDETVCFETKITEEYAMQTWYMALTKGQKVLLYALAILVPMLAVLFMGGRKEGLAIALLFFTPLVILVFLQLGSKTKA